MSWFVAGVIVLVVIFVLAPLVIGLCLRVVDKHARKHGI